MRVIPKVYAAEDLEERRPMAIVRPNLQALWSVPTKSLQRSGCNHRYLRVRAPMDSQFSRKRVQARKDASDSGTPTDFESTSSDSDNASLGSQGEATSDVDSREVH